MKVELDISRNILEQFHEAFVGTPATGMKRLAMDRELGIGTMELVELPNKLELYHYTSTLEHPLEIVSTNPAESRWFGLNISLDDTGLERRVGATKLTIQRSRPSGILVHTPGSEITGVNPAGQHLEAAFVRFHDDFVDEYFGPERDALRPEHGVVLFEDLDYRSEMLLRDAVSSLADRIHVHARMLELMGLFQTKIAARESEPDAERLHPQDIRGLFRAATALREPLMTDRPSIQTLAELAHMGTTKFKASFRAVFGISPHRYHLKVKMDFARDELASGRKTPSELSYELGYSHPSKFTAAFKKHFGYLPSHVRGGQFRP